MTTATKNLIRVGSVEEVKQRGCMVVTGGGHTIAVFRRDDEFAAVDNRCPHMGFPLDRGTVKNGILTCHWHHARFDLSSGGTFDPFADDVRSFPVSVEDDTVWVDPSPPEPDPIERWSHRLEGRAGAQHTAGYSEVGSRTELGGRRLPSPADDRGAVRHDLFGAGLGTGDDNADVRREHSETS